MRRFGLVAAGAAVMVGLLAPAASAGPLQRIADLQHQVLALPTPTVFDTTCPVAGAQPDGGRAHRCTVGTAECLDEYGPSTGHRQGCGAALADLVAGCYQQGRVSGGAGGYGDSTSLRCDAGTVSVSCGRTFGVGGGSSRDYLECTAWPVAYSEEVSSGSYTANKNETNVSAGSVRLTCTNLPDEASCAPA